MKRAQWLLVIAGIVGGILLAAGLCIPNGTCLQIAGFVVLVLVGAWALWWWWHPDLEDRRLEVLAAISDAQGTVEEAIERAKMAQSPLPGPNAGEIVSILERLRNEARAAVDSDTLETLESRATELAHLRAHLYPKESLAPEAKLCLATLKEWGVPADVVTNLEKELLPVVTGSDVLAAREALRAIFEEYDAWSEYVDWYATDYMPRLNVLFLVLVTLSVALALNRFVARDVILGLIFAGTSGALVSILTRLPKFSVYGELSPALLSIFSRVGTGLAATAVGVGLLASGIFTITLPLPQGASGGTDGAGLPLTRIIEICGRPKLKDRATIHATPGPTILEPSNTATGSALAGKSDAGQPSDKKGVAPVDCTTGNLFTLLAIGLLLGFSERALPAFEEKIFPVSKSTPKKDGT